MALLRTKEIRAMDVATREKKLRELRDELMHERGVAAMGGAPPNPGKIRALRKNIARIHTIQSEEAAPGALAAAPVPPKGQEEAARTPAPPQKSEGTEDEEGTDEDLPEDEA